MFRITFVDQTDKRLGKDVIIEAKSMTGAKSAMTRRVRSGKINVPEGAVGYRIVTPAFAQLIP